MIRLDLPDLTLAGAEKRLLEVALAQARGNKQAAARLLGIPRPTLYDRLAHHGLHTPARRGPAGPVPA